MKATVVITHDGRISVVTREGTFEEGKKRLEELMKALNLEGVEFAEPLKEFERHRHDHEKARVKRGVRNS